MKYTKLDIYKKRLRRMRRKLGAQGGHRLCAEITALIGEIPSFRVHSAGSLPLITHALADTDEFTTESVYEALLPYADVLDNADFMTLMWQVRFAALLKASQDGEKPPMTAAGVISSMKQPMWMRGPSMRSSTRSVTAISVTASMR